MSDDDDGGRRDRDRGFWSWATPFVVFLVIVVVGVIAMILFAPEPAPCG